MEDKKLSTAPSSAEPHMKDRSYRGKKTIDRIFGVVCFILFLPLILFLTVYVFILIDRRPFFLQTRIGYGRRPFKILKFKTINRSGKIPMAGRILRRLKLDEILQLINVVRGDMSFVGPRPYIPEESENLPDERFRMKPGMTGLAQVYGNRVLGWDVRTAYDLDYVRDNSPLLDFRIILRTVKLMIVGEKACLKKREG